MWQSTAEKRAETRAEAERVFAEASRWVPIDPRLVECLREHFPQTTRPPRIHESDRAIWMSAGARDVIETLHEICQAQQASADLTGG